LIRVAPAKFRARDRLTPKQPLVDRQIAWHPVVDNVDLADVAPDIGLRRADESDTSEPEFECLADSAPLEGLCKPDVGESDVLLIGSVKSSESVFTDKELEIAVAQRPRTRDAALIGVFRQAENERVQLRSDEVSFAALLQDDSDA
jgi:hypothetical protein